MTRYLVAACLLALLAPACSSRPEGEVGMQARAFDPQEIVIQVGETVTWVNDGDEVHTVTARGDSIPAGGSYFASGGAPNESEAREDPSRGFIEPGESFKFKFEEAGTYEYFCIPHDSSGMAGTVVVEE